MRKSTMVTIVLGFIALAMVLGYALTLPTTLRLQVPAQDFASRKLFDAAAEHFKSKNLPIRLEVKTSPNAEDALAALDRGDADLAVARAEELIKTKAQTALILREEGAIVLAPKTGKVKAFPDIATANVGIVREEPASLDAFAAMARYYGIDTKKIKSTALEPDDVGAALREKKIDALIVLGNPNSKFVSDLVMQAMRSTSGGIKIIEIEAAEAIAKRVPEMDSIEIKKGQFSGSPPVPEDEIKTVGYTVRLAASDKLSADHAAELIRQLLNVRQNLGAVAPGATSIKAPETDEETPFVIHPGVMAYGTGELKSFFDRYGDWLYIGLFVTSGLGSAVAGGFSWFNGKRRARVMSHVRDVAKLADAANEANSTQELDEIEHSVQRVFAFALRHATRETIDEANIITFRFALDEARGRINRRRAILASAPGQPSGQLVPFKPASNPQAS